MKKMIRFSLSGLVGLGITAGLFVGMLNLLNGDKPTFSNEATDIRFSFVKAYEPLTIKDPIKPEKPEPQEISQAPAMPQMPSIEHELPVEGLPQDGTTGIKPNLLASIGLQGYGTPHGGTVGKPGGVKTAIAPMYPQKPLLSKTEGWVKLLIQVNEFGQVSDARVIDAKPARVFNTAALKAVKKWTFYPQIENGKGVPFQVSQTIEFSLDQ
jgi:protein TonB